MSTVGALSVDTANHDDDNARFEVALEALLDPAELLELGWDPESEAFTRTLFIPSSASGGAPSRAASDTRTPPFATSACCARSAPADGSCPTKTTLTHSAPGVRPIRCVASHCVWSVEPPVTSGRQGALACASLVVERTGRRDRASRSTSREMNGFPLPFLG
jgi:hypothetical protein